MTEFHAPSPMDAIDWKTLYGHLLAIWPAGRESVATKFGEKTAVRAAIYDLDSGQAVSSDALIFPRALVMQVSGVPVGSAVVGRLGQGESRGGQNPPWKLADPTAEDLTRAKAYFTAHPHRGTQPTPAQQGLPQPPTQMSAQTPAQPVAGTGAHYPITGGYQPTAGPPAPF